MTILADTAVRAHDIDEAAAIAAKQRAEEALASNDRQDRPGRGAGRTGPRSEQLKILEKLRKIRG